MDLSKITIYKLLEEKMSYLSQRQAVLAQNVANADTPGYKPQDLQDFTFKTAMAGGGGQLNPLVTNPAHMGGAANGSSFKAQKKKSYETTQDGNGVVLEEQMTKVGDTSSNYNEITNLYKKQLSLITLALDKGS